VLVVCICDPSYLGSQDWEEVVLAAFSVLEPTVSGIQALEHKQSNRKRPQSNTTGTQ
jgi:hypothetical protein